MSILWWGTKGENSLPLERVPTAEEIEETEIIVLGELIDSHHVASLMEQIKLSGSRPSIIRVTGVDSFEGRTVEKEEDLPRAIAQATRLRKLQAENERLVAKLTEANQLLEEKNKKLDEFTATVAHDIRGPLGGIVMKLQYVLDTFELPERVNIILKKALGSGERLTHVVQGMYELAKIGAKAATMEFVDLNRLLKEMVSDLSLDEVNNLELEIGELPKVWGNQTLLSRMFHNLISNAIKHNDKERVRITIKERARFERSLASFVEIEIKDNGPGIPKELREQIFSPFFRASKTEGLGLGLSVVKKIVDLHFGNISIDDSFIVSLPTERLEFSRS
jgi:signal transduction histidine kinase